MININDFEQSLEELKITIDSLKISISMRMDEFSNLYKLASQKKLENAPQEEIAALVNEMKSIVSLLLPAEQMVKDMYPEFEDMFDKLKMLQRSK